MDGTGLALMTKAPEPPRTQAAPGQANAWPLRADLGPLGALPTVPRLARAFTGLVLAGWGLGRMDEDCALIVSELTSNVIRAATGPDGQPRYDDRGTLPALWPRLLSDRVWLRLEVRDTLAPERGVPVERRAAATDENGRGLELVKALSQDWGWDMLPGSHAKCVWAVLA
jgi:hypothetical protein